MIKIIANRKIWFTFSSLTIIASIFFLIVFGLKLGLDFTGGTLLEVKFEAQLPSPQEVNFVLAPLEVGEALIQTTEENGIILRAQTIDEAKHQEILRVLKDNFGNILELRFESIGPVLGEELKKKSLGALLLVFLAITLYVAWSFRRVAKPVSSWVYGVVTLITAFHDVIIPLGLFALLGRVLNVEIGSSYVAAILTIMGYSINDTIVVLDRVRENLTRQSGDFEGVVEQSVKQTLVRSVNTSVTTSLALIAIFFFGGESLKWFSLALIVGIATGTYSSIFIASPLLVVWDKWKRK